MSLREAIVEGLSDDDLDDYNSTPEAYLGEAPKRRESSVRDAFLREVIL